jgi:hypothetical protein
MDTVLAELPNVPRYQGAIGGGVQLVEVGHDLGTEHDRAPG